jgi:hypothetical protein
MYANEKDWADYGDAQQAAVMNAHERLEKELRAAGKYKGCAGLQPSSTATTVRIRGGKTKVSDGPFAETKEQLGGYYLIEAKNIDEAVKIAARIPGVPNRAVELRPVAAIIE